MPASSSSSSSSSASGQPPPDLPPDLSHDLSHGQPPDRPRNVRSLAVLTVRNEGALLLDWIAHHQTVGFTDFLIASNDCEDGTDALLDRLDQLGIASHLPNPAPHDGGVQWAALKRADRHPLLTAPDWVLALDIDEFVNIHAGDGTLDALRATLPDASCITLTWRLFGNGGIVDYRDAPVTDQFTRAAPTVLHWPWRAAMFKTLYRHDGTYRKLGVHRPRSPDPERIDQARWFDGSGRELPATFRNERIFSDFGRDNYSLAQINHYALGSMESFVLKSDRGRAVHGTDTLGMDYWTDRNFCDAQDVTITRYRNATRARRAALASDPVLAGLHAAAVRWRHARIAALLAGDGPRALFGRLRMAPPSRVLSSAIATEIREKLTKG